MRTEVDVERGGSVVDLGAEVPAAVDDGQLGADGADEALIRRFDNETRRRRRKNQEIETDRRFFFPERNAHRVHRGPEKPRQPRQTKKNLVKPSKTR